MERTDFFMMFIPSNFTLRIRKVIGMVACISSTLLVYYTTLCFNLSAINSAIGDQWGSALLS